ncbi:prephenate dehydrogenase [Lactarius sanguifluus]|nr:prephenate dehydrogenase [Lactarius sanguifluus]
MGAMGKMYTGWKNHAGISVFPDGRGVSRTSDLIVYSIEVESINKKGKNLPAIVAGQTSSRPEFEQYLPDDVHIVSCHSMHGPTVPTKGQPLALIKHRASDEALKLVENIFRPFQSQHDKLTANTQAVTHAAFLSMGTASSYPWEHGYYVSGIEMVKANIMLCIFSNKWHVYAGLVILNLLVRAQIKPYAQSTMDIFKLMPAADEHGLRKRMYEARGAVFGYAKGPVRRPILLLERRVDCWVRLGHNPVKHLRAMPIFRMWFGVAEYLFRSEGWLDTAIHAALYDVLHRYDDVEFVVASCGRSQCVSSRLGFQETAMFFKSRFEEAERVGSEMLGEVSAASSSSGNRTIPCSLLPSFQCQISLYGTLSIRMSSFPGLLSPRTSWLLI